MTRSEKEAVKRYLLAVHASRDPRGVRFHCDGSVTLGVMRMPNNGQPGRMFAGWAKDLLHEMHVVEEVVESCKIGLPHAGRITKREGESDDI